jgi:hypothetical protein
MAGTPNSSHIRVYQRQLAVIKGQAWNIVQSLKHDVSQSSSLKLPRRADGFDTIG